MPVIIGPSRCVGAVQGQLFVITQAGALPISCPVGKVLSWKARLFGWKGKCAENPVSIIPNQDYRFTAEKGTIVLELLDPESFEKIFGLAFITYKTANGLILSLKQLPNEFFHGKGLALLKIDTARGCDILPTVIDDSIPTYNSHVEAGCCPCTEELESGHVH